MNSTATIGIVLLSVVALFVIDTVAKAYAPSGRRWPTVTGMEVPVVFLIDENGYYATQSCTVTSFTEDGITNMKCVDAPTIIQVGNK